jgi:hypothetical protein
MRVDPPPRIQPARSESTSVEMNSAPPEYPARWMRVASTRCSATTLAARARNQSPTASLLEVQDRLAGATGTTRIMFLAAARAAMLRSIDAVGRWA